MSTDNSQALPRVAITYCTQCRWLLRAAYFGQELLSTFGTSIGEVALKPATGGIFTVHLTYKPVQTETLQQQPEEGTAGVPAAADGGDGVEVRTVRIWDRKVDGGFPEPKVLKQRVRDFIDPGRGLGHSDTPGRGKAENKQSERKEQQEGAKVDGDEKTSGVGADKECEDCK